MVHGIERVRHREPLAAVGDVVVVLAAFVAHHVALVLQAGLGDRVEEVPHALALEPERGLEPVGRHHLVVVGAIGIGRAVDLERPDALQDPEVLVLAGVLGALKHHVLEQVRKPGLAGKLVAAADVVPDAHRDLGNRPIDVQDDLEPVVEPKGLVRHLEGLASGRGGRGAECRKQRERMIRRRCPIVHGIGRVLQFTARSIARPVLHRGVRTQRARSAPTLTAPSP